MANEAVLSAIAVPRPLLNLRREVAYGSDDVRPGAAANPEALHQDLAGVPGKLALLVVSVKCQGAFWTEGSGRGLERLVACEALVQV